MPEQEKALRRRIAPAVPLKLELEDDSGATFVRNFRLSFDFNAVTLVEETTGFSLLSGAIWKRITAKNLSLLFYAAILANHPEFDTDDGLGNKTTVGLEVVRSYMDGSNMAQITEAVSEAYTRSLAPEDQARIRKAQAEEKAKGNKSTLPTSADAPAETKPEAAAATS